MITHRRPQQSMQPWGLPDPVGFTPLSDGLVLQCLLLWLVNGGGHCPSASAIVPARVQSLDLRAKSRKWSVQRAQLWPFGRRKMYWCRVYCAAMGLQCNGGDFSARLYAQQQRIQWFVTSRLTNSYLHRFWVCRCEKSWWELTQRPCEPRVCSEMHSEALTTQQAWVQHQGSLTSSFVLPWKMYIQGCQVHSRIENSFRRPLASRSTRTPRASYGTNSNDGRAS